MNGNNILRFKERLRQAGRVGYPTHTEVLYAAMEYISEQYEHLNLSEVSAEFARMCERDGQGKEAEGMCESDS